MAKPKIELDHAAIGGILGGGKVAGMTLSAARQIAGATGATAHGVAIPTEAKAKRLRLKRDTAERAGAEVILKHPAASRVEAKRGNLTRAAASIGAEVHKW